MLLNEFLKEHKKVEEQTKTVVEQANKINAQASKIERLEAALEKMTARLDAKGFDVQLVRLGPRRPLMKRFRAPQPATLLMTRREYEDSANAVPSVPTLGRRAN
jgi:hypothetical protein